VSEKREISSPPTDELPTLPQSCAETDVANGEQSLRVEAVSRLTRSEEAILEIGKQMVERSGRGAVDFHKTMLGLAATFTAAMVTFFGFGSTALKLGFVERIAFAGPIVTMLASTLVFAFGYFPSFWHISFDFLDEIEATHNRSIERRKHLAIVGMFLFAVAVIWAIVDVLFLAL
jgi:hypothetical protein